MAEVKKSERFKKKKKLSSVGGKMGVRTAVSGAIPSHANWQLPATSTFGVVPATSITHSLVKTHGYCMQFL